MVTPDDSLLMKLADFVVGCLVVNEAMIADSPMTVNLHVSAGVTEDYYYCCDDANGTTVGNYYYYFLGYLGLVSIETMNRADDFRLVDISWQSVDPSKLDS